MVVLSTERGVMDTIFILIIILIVLLIKDTMEDDW